MSAASHNQGYRPDSQLSAVPYLPGLDGMRALAVVVVMIYHASDQWLGGGFLGVEVFFVISGYLITMLLMAERERDGRIHLGQFWLRRAKRLLPALGVLLLAVVIYSSFFRTGDLGKVRGDVIAGMTYVSNWFQIWIGDGYAAAGDFVPLRHLWSLAVEEQFYLIWPLVMVAFLARRTTRQLALTARWLILAAVVIAGVTALVFVSGRIDTCQSTPQGFWTIAGRCISKADTLYLSTITRSTGILLGAAFAMVWRPKAIMRGPLRRAHLRLDLIGLVGIAVLAVLVWRLHFVTANGYDAWLFRGGFLVTDVATLAVIAPIAHEHSWLSRILALQPLRWIGTRSYGLYLYHWFIYQIIRKVAGRPLTIVEFVVAMVITVVITEASYRIVETPVRRGTWRPWLTRLLNGRNPRPRQVLAGVSAVMVVVTGWSVVRLVTAEVQLNELERSFQEGESQTVSADDLLGRTTTPTTAPVPSTTAPVVTTAPTTTSTTTTLPPEPVDYLAIGDSVMLGAASELTNRGYTVMAEQNRQLTEMIPVFKEFAENDVFGDPVIIHLGTNGAFTAGELDALLAPLSNVPNVVLLNVHADRSWTEKNNELLAARDGPGDNIWFIDWNALSEQCPGNCFTGDGIHLNPAGARYYADLIDDVLGR
ncbi:MAG: hypothetical protein CSA55_03190 [Ilumatobacter coccineus]|uniref:Acyltransferase 3 domain-containing protein n=1 Tax=Ilumatobacter coccineus TaxID=467094 RepID=A0A2G6KA70_9ACTN|nr:MAG: hypothetical protein CSA55_03190 [Ilumatobacter coccineus]